MNWNLEQIELVKSRLFLLKQLESVKENFRGLDKVIDIDEDDEHPYKRWEHPYKDFVALRYYLALTCFDILGQPNEWLDFNCWLQSKRTEKQRNNIISKYSTNDLSQFIWNVNNDYNKTYGVKNSFYRFIREILSESNKEKLFSSISTSRQLTPTARVGDQIIVGTGETIILPIEKKEQFLFEIRNSFTHKGVSFASSVGGLTDTETLRIDPITKKQMWACEGIYKKTINNDLVTFSVRRWPNVLIEIIEDIIKY